ncbi:TetR/AcrR family transcriptional regulator [Streptomyces sp. NPDC059740]|uniref:TetR/AcrR family transcriptional regulator n=1 Tax=Streptomyces sp. NPDC059740 TaxID=3346926 RepID=UPI00364D77C2
MTEQSPPRMRADARRNRARVLTAAREAFARDGLFVPFDEIARRAGVGPGTLYRHFPTKEALFDAVLLDRVQSLSERVRELSQAPVAGAAFFEAVSLLLSESAAKKDLLDALAGAGIDVSASLTEANRDLWAALAHLLTRAQDAGAVRADLGVEDLAVLLRALFLAGQREPVGTASQERVIAVVRDGLRA